MIDLRDYQEALTESARKAMREHRNVLLQAPTGSGKTVIASHMMGRAAEKDYRSFFICHRRELLDQTAETFRRFGIPFGIIAAGYKPDDEPVVQICSIDTLKNRLDKVAAPHFCIWDEAHHLGAAGWSKVHAHFPKAYHLGLSATPTRLDGRGLDATFDSLVPGPSVRWLIDNGHLAKYKLYSVPGVSMSGVKVVRGDYAKKETAAAMDLSTITGDIISHWVKLGGGKRTIVFAVTVAHSKNIVASFNAAGISAVHLDATTKKDTRRAELRAFARGETSVISNVGLFGEGFDAAANSGMDVTVGAIIDAAPTRSLGAWLQRCGRALRPQEGAVILDHAGNALRHGLPCQERVWSLYGRDKTRKKSEDIELESVVQCPECFFVQEPGLPACEECGYIFPKKGRIVTELGGELEELDTREEWRQKSKVLERWVAEKQAKSAALKKEQASARTYEELVRLGRKRGYLSPRGWAYKIMNSRTEPAWLKMKNATKRR